MNTTPGPLNVLGTPLKPCSTEPSVKRTMKRLGRDRKRARISGSVSERSVLTVSSPLVNHRPAPTGTARQAPQGGAPAPETESPPGGRGRRGTGHFFAWRSPRTTPATKLSKRSSATLCQDTTSSRYFR